MGPSRKGPSTILPSKTIQKLQTHKKAEKTNNDNGDTNDMASIINTADPPTQTCDRGHPVPKLLHIKNQPKCVHKNTKTRKNE